MTDSTSVARSELVPTGTPRVALNMSNFLLTATDSCKAAGVRRQRRDFSASFLRVRGRPASDDHGSTEKLWGSAARNPDQFGPGMYKAQRYEMQTVDVGIDKTNRIYCLQCIRRYFLDTAKPALESSR
jgi:hypothetical protein